ncbi:hypothetical protein Q5692_10845 [Microcoleus sp. C2C3]|uniref:hypothetical protein n=1 Tax=unclassified Microcoleus TaxID=2642155 RepID=UPI002FCF13E8
MKGDRASLQKHSLQKERSHVLTYSKRAIDLEREKALKGDRPSHPKKAITPLIKTFTVARN